MKRLLIVLLPVIGGLIGCKDTKPIERYFYVYYQANETDRTTHSGDIWFNWVGFPTKNQIDSMIYSGLNKRKECYQPLLISYFFEFKSKDDFGAFGSNYKGNFATAPKKAECCTICPDSIQFGGGLYLDSAGTIIPIKDKDLKAIQVAHGH